MQADPYALVAIAVVAVATLLDAGFGARFSSRTVGPKWNAAAISGEYLSAASFLGIAGLVLKDGVDALWYPVGFTAGYLALLLFVAAPLRRSGAYTLPDFAEARLRSTKVRRIATALVVIIGWLYVVPQLQGAGLTLSTLTGWATWTGPAVVIAIVLTNVLVGGMRSITFVQAFQYWLKLAALAVPVFVLLLTVAGERTEATRAITADAPPAFTVTTTIDVQTDVTLQVSSPTLLSANGRVDGQRAIGTVYWGEGDHLVRAGTQLTFSPGSPVPVVVGSPASNADWLRPLSRGDDEGGRGLLLTYSLILATFLGTMGLPHVLVRFYTNPDGRTARTTTLGVLALLGVFYLFPAVCGVLARLYEPQLLVTGATDAAVLLLPSAVLDSWPARVLAALVAAGAFAAFLAASSGLVVSVAGVLSTDVLPARFRDLRVAAVVAALVPLGFAVWAQSLDIAQVVAMAFAVAASSFAPLLLLGIWWRGLTAAGAISGIVLGGGLALAAVLCTIGGVGPSGFAGDLMTQPAIVTVPLAFASMIVVSLATARRRPSNVARLLARLHAPEGLGLQPDPATPGPAATDAAPGAPAPGPAADPDGSIARRAARHRRWS